MTTGIVNASIEATIPLLVCDASVQVQTVEFVIDTGFDGSLTMPNWLITSLKLIWLQRVTGTLVDGSQKEFDVYFATVIWDGQKRHLRVEAADAAPLVGMDFLRGCELRIQVIPGGTVVVDSIP